MVAYFDLENLESFLKQPKNDFYHDCLKLLKKQLDLSFNFNKEEFKKSDDLMNFIKILSDGVGDKKIKYIPEKFPARNIKSNSHRLFSIDELLSVYFINNEDLEKLKAKEDLLIADIGEEMILFKLLFLGNDDYKFEKKINIKNDFTDWGKLVDFYTPHTDIIIVDNFILSDSSLIDTNLKNIIGNSLKDASRKKVNILIFIREDEYKTNLNDLKKIIVPCIKAKCTDDPNITIIKHYREHDRTILRNMLRIYSGDTFNYFWNNGSLKTNGKEIHFSSIADKDNYKLYKNTLSDLQNIIDTALAEKIIGDKESRFLKFK